MRRLANGTQVASLPAISAPVGTPGYGTDGDPGAGQLGSIYGEDEYNVHQEEIVAATIDTGVALDNSGAVLTQLRQSIRRSAGTNSTGINASTALTLDQLGLIEVSAATGNVVLTLPAANAAGGRSVEFHIARTDTVAANTVSVQRVGGDTIEGATSIAVAPGQRLTLRSNGASAWRAIAGGPFTSGPGWQLLPSGLLMQWGSGLLTAANQFVAFPIAFPNQVHGIHVTESGGGSWPTGFPTLYGSGGINGARSGFTVVGLTWSSGGGWVAPTPGAGIDFFYTAIGR